MTTTTDFFDLRDVFQIERKTPDGSWEPWGGPWQGYSDASLCLSLARKSFYTEVRLVDSKGEVVA